jgi:FAD/FMN-containing dehydrogenase
MTNEKIAVEKIRDGLKTLVGEAHVLTDEATMAPYLTDWRKRYKGKALCVVKPASTEEVAAVMRFAHEHALKMVPQGGNTGLVGGSVPLGRGDEIVLSLTRLCRITEIDPVADIMIVEAGATLKDVQDYAEQHDRLFPLSLASEGTATIGGAISTNAGGTAVLAYGTMRDLVSGVEAVLANGEIWHGLSKLKKDNTGYDLNPLFVGSEGTLGIVTAAAIKLFPKPKSRATALCGVASVEDALNFFQLAKSEAGRDLTTFELMPRLGIELLVKHYPEIRDPLFFAHQWYLLVEFSSAFPDAADTMAQRLVMEGIDKAVIEDSLFAVSLAQRDFFWHLRETLPEVQTREGASIKHDISVPIDQIPTFINEVSKALQSLVPECRPFVFGHVGDGNLHFNVQAPSTMAAEEFLARSQDIHELVYAYFVRAKGSISAEHGIGQLKRERLAATKNPTALDLMRRIKAALDPDNRLNPGKIL